MLVAMDAYKSLRGVGLATVVLLALNAASVLATIPSSLAQLALADRIATGDFLEADLVANDLRQQLLAIAGVGLMLVTAVVFIVWFHRAYTNLRAWNHEPAHGPGWAIGGWFVPILSLFRPYQIAREIWSASGPASPDDEPALQAGSPILVAWWTAWIADNILGQITFRVSMNVETPSGLSTATQLQIVNDALMCVAAILALLVVRAITRRQEERAAQTAGLAQGELDAIQEAFD